MPFDPFGDYEQRGYLRNRAGEKDLEVLRRLEHRAFSGNVKTALEHLAAQASLTYEDVLTTHRRLFGSVYPWAGQDRSALAPHIAISKGGVADLFAHPADVRRAAEYGLGLGAVAASMRRRPGEVFGALAYAHPFLDGNGRALMTMHADITRRAGFHITWHEIGKDAFLRALTEELRSPGKPLDALLASHIRHGPMPMRQVATELSRHPGLRGGAAPSP